jgi:hypothetical protein
VHDTSPTLGDVIRRFGAALRVQHGETMTAAQKAVLSALERCRTEALGGHLYRCDRCGAEHVAYNSCRSRHCPSCLGHKSAQWLEARSDELLPVPYFHVVFTVPQQIAALAWANKKLIYEILFRAAAQTLLQIARDPRHLGAHIGFLAILHTWTQTLLYHPHVHCVVPGGGLSPDHERWIGCRDNFFLPVKVLSRLFRGKFLALLDAAAKSGAVRFAGSTAPLADPTAWRSLLRQIYRKDWVVYSKPPFGSPQQVLKYLARYTHRVAISNRRIASLTDEHVTFRYRDRTQANAIREMTLHGVEFLRRFLLHVLPKGFVRIRHFGLLANRVRKTNLAVCRSLLGQTSAAPQDPTQARDNDQPALCPICQTGRLRLIATLAPVVAFQPHGPRLSPPDTS